MPPYSRLVSSCDASEKYACVTSAVAAIPTPATRAPRAYDDLAVFDTDQEHGPRERGADLLYRAVLREQRLEAHLRPVVHVAGRIAERLPVRAARHVDHAPDRLARHGHEQPALGDARHLVQRLLGLGHVLEHLDRRCHVELVVLEAETRGLLGAVFQVRARAGSPFRLELRILEVDPDDAVVLQLLRPLVGEHALAAADVEHGFRSGLLPQV